MVEARDLKRMRCTFESFEGFVLFVCPFVCIIGLEVCDKLAEKQGIAFPIDTRVARAERVCAFWLLVFLGSPRLTSPLLCRFKLCWESHD